ncbi:MAG: hypothetical protein R3Y18_05465 [Bacillota bacterium]
MANFYIENERIKLGINLKGGSLISFVDKKRGEEMLWQADPAFWPNHDVVIFPIVGLHRTPYEFEGKEYHIETMHGFTRNQEFAVIEDSGDAVLLEISATEETLKEYPFNFKLGLKYELLGAGYKLTYIVTSLDGKDMPFYIGGHAGLNVPKGDTFAIFEQENDFYHYPQTNGPSFDEAELVFENTKEIFLDKNYYVEKDPKSGELDFSKGCMLERNFKGGCTLKRADGISYKVDIGDSSLLTLWGFKDGGDYFCVEPWWGIKQTESMGRDLFKLPKINIVGSEPKEYYYSIEVVE